MKKTKQIVLILVILAICSITGIFGKTTFATNSEPIATVASADLGTILSEGSSWVSQDDAQVNQYAIDFAIIGQVLVGIGAATVLIVGLIIAIQWTVATPDKQAQLKGRLIGLVAATVVIFGAVGIWAAVRNVGSEIESKLGSAQSHVQIASNSEK